MNSLNGLKHEKGPNKNKNFRHSTTLSWFEYVGKEAKCFKTIIKLREKYLGTNVIFNNGLTKIAITEKLSVELS